MANRTRKILLSITVIVIALHLIPVERTNPPVKADLKAPPEVKAILQRACYDCHSNETRWPWYSYVRPVAWVIASDVNAGRRELNFSNWGQYSLKRRKKLKREIGEAIAKGEMPLGIYLWMHSEATLTPEIKAVIVRWTKSP